MQFFLFKATFLHWLLLRICLTTESQDKTKKDLLELKFAPPDSDNFLPAVDHMITFTFWLLLLLSWLLSKKFCSLFDKINHIYWNKYSECGVYFGEER